MSVLVSYLYFADTFFTAFTNNYAIWSGTNEWIIDAYKKNHILNIES